jgi:single-strand DNA-binding protein
MANLNKVMLIGRLTRDPETRAFSNGGKVASFGFAVNNKRKNSQTGQWEDDPVFLDVEAFNRPTGQQQADLVEQSLRKGNQVFIEGHMKLDQWTAQDGQKRQKIKIVVDNFQFLEPRGEGIGAPRSSGGYQQRQPTSQPTSGGPDEGYDAHEPPPMDPPPPGRAEGDIPF